MTPIYLDYAATTPVDPAVAAKMQLYLTMPGIFGNPTSLHEFGSQAKAAVELARVQVALTIGAAAEEIIWTSGATESNNLALKGVARLYANKGKHIVTVKSEHKSVLDSCQQLEKEGFSITYLTPQKNGLIDLQEFAAALQKDTILVSIMQVNNELGVIQDIAAIAKITSTRGILFHSDIAQSSGKVTIDVAKTPVDLLSLCAHKAYGPKGIGALYVRKKPRVRLAPLLHGGGQEQGLRSGTLATHQIVGMGEALALAEEMQNQEWQRILQLRNYFLENLRQFLTIEVNGDLNNSVPHILNLQFKGLIAQAIIDKFPAIAVSTASACQGQDQGSHVLLALGLTQEEIKSSIRFSFGRFTTRGEIDEVLQLLSS